LKLRDYIIVAIAIICASVLAFTGAESSVSAQTNTHNNQSYQIMIMIEQPANHIRAGSGYSSGYGNARQKVIRKKLGKNIAKKYGLKFLDNWPMPLLNIECFIMEIPAGKEIENVISEISLDNRISWVEPMVTYQVLANKKTYNDPLYPVSPAAQKWKIADLHNRWTGQNVSIAVVDTQIEQKHPDLIGRVSIVKNFTAFADSKAELHGTSVAGVIAANANNGLGIAGVAPKAKLVGLRACWQSTNNNKSICNTLSLARALNYAIEKRINIINLSLGGPPSKLLSKLISKASHKKITIEWYLADGSSYAAAHVSGLLALMHECKKVADRNCNKLIYNSNERGTIDVKASLM